MVRKSLELSFQNTEEEFVIENNFKETMEKAAIPLFQKEITEIVFDILNSEVNEFKLVMS